MMGKNKIILKLKVTVKTFSDLIFIYKTTKVIAQICVILLALNVPLMTLKLGNSDPCNLPYLALKDIEHISKKDFLKGSNLVSNSNHQI